MYWPWYHNERILDKTELEDRKYRVRNSNVYTINDEVYNTHNNTELLRLNLKSKSDKSSESIPTDIKLIMNNHHLNQFEKRVNNPNNDKKDFIQTINIEFEKDWPDNTQSKIFNHKIPYWNYKPNSDELTHTKEPLNHWKVAMDV